jgi:hypothetical protein
MFVVLEIRLILFAKFVVKPLDKANQIDSYEIITSLGFASSTAFTITTRSKLLTF